VDEAAQLHFAGPLKAELAASIVADLDKSAWLSGPGWALELVGKWWNPQQIAWRGGDPLPAWPTTSCRRSGRHAARGGSLAACVRQGLSVLVPQALSRQVLGWVERGLQPAKR
jgi:hypothetical protein